MNPENYRNGEEKTFYEYLEKLTDRELQEKQALYLRNIEKTNLSIKNNIQFWFYATIISVALTIIILGSK
jgi:hypothetical protein